MLAYNNDEKFRARFLDEIRWHQESDALQRGTYGVIDDAGNWRGCAVGCSLRSLNRMAGSGGSDTRQHARYEAELGIPVQLAYLEDRLFESLPLDLAFAWPMRFSSAIRAGADLSLVWAQFAHWLLVDETDGVIRFAKTDRSRNAIRDVAALFERQCQSETVSKAEFQAARKDAAAADAASATCAAYAAYAAADAADAAYATYAASATYADAAASAAYAAYADAAHAYARTKAFVRQADKLIELLEAA